MPRVRTLRAHRWTCSALMLCGLALPSAGLIAQQTPGSWGSITGVVVDSLHDRPLDAALIAAVQQPDRNTLSAASGTFRLDSLPPGTYTLEIEHPLLDSLGIRLVSDPVTVTAGGVSQTTLRVPPASALIASMCPAAKRRFGPGVLVGKVLDADSDAPLEGAAVSLAWVEASLATTGDAQVEMRRDPRVRSATTSADGTFRICGIPTAFTGTLQAERNAVKTAELPLVVTDALVTVQVLRLPITAHAVAPSSAAVATDTSGTPPTATSPNGITPAASTPASTSATITGVVTNRGGVPLADVRISVQGSPATGTSRADGTFTVTGAPLGTQVVIARRVGYEPVERSLDVTSQGPNTITLRLATAVTPQLTSVDVKAKARAATALAHTGFDDRKRMGFGRFVTAADLDKWQSASVSDALRHVPGVQVSESNGRVAITSSRGRSCLTYLIDRMPTNPANGGPSLDDLVKPSDIAAMELYQVGTVPNELMIGQSSGCALLVIWTVGQLKTSEKASPPSQTPSR